MSNLPDEQNAMDQETAIIIGATGLVGSRLLQLLLYDDRVNQVKVFHRRSTGIKHPKLTEHVIDFDDISDWKHLISGNSLYSALGTTIKKAGSQEAQYKIDYTCQFEVAQAAAENKVERYALVSSAGANSQSRNFYIRLKGKLDEDVKELPFEKTVVLRPSILLGDRNENRPGETVGLFFARFLTKIPGLKKYRPIPADTVAQGMIHGLRKCTPGYHIIELDEIFHL